MSEADIEVAMKKRVDHGYEGGMPPGAKISLEEAQQRWESYSNREGW